MSDNEPEDVDPETAAAAMNGEQTPETDPNGDSQAVEIGPEAPETETSVIDRLLSTEPNPSLSDVEHPFNPEEGGLKRVYRGVLKLGDIDGMPAIWDIGAGLLEEYIKRSGDGDSGESDSQEINTGVDG